MSNLLWRYYHDDNVDKFRRHLENGSSAQHQHTPMRPFGGNPSSAGVNAGSPAGNALASSPRNSTKSRKSSAYAGGSRGNQNAVSPREINARDHAGLTLLHRVASSTAENAIAFAKALIQHPSIDLYIQDMENGWTALHRALYFGNVTIARAIIDRDFKDATAHGGGNSVLRAGSLIKIKDFEGNSPFDVYNSTIARRTLERGKSQVEEDEEDESDDETVDEEGNITHTREHLGTSINIEGDELFAFGSNKNLTLGFGDEDDRQYPEKITLKRPDHLVHRFYREYLAQNGQDNEIDMPSNVEDLPALIQNRPILIQDVSLSKLQSAILTTDPESNLYVCGFGPGGRLGTGDEVTRFSYVCLDGGALASKHVSSVALGQNHTLAITSDGEVFSWGTNTWGQLGYSLPRPVMKDEEPVQSSPRQIFGPLKKEIIIGVAASAIHSVAHTATALFVWGKNEGQLGLMDSDARSLEAQTVPRRVAASLFSSQIKAVSAIDRATIVLLANHSVYVFSHYGHINVKFELEESFSNFFMNRSTLTTRYDAVPNHISQITAGGDTIAAVSSRGDLFTLSVSQKLEGQSATSTTNPSKIRNALSQPQRIWSLRKGNWDGIKSVSVAENGSVIICTKAGAVWRRVKRAKIQDTHGNRRSEYKQKDYKFQRVAGLTKVAAVRSNAFGAYAAIRKDADVTKSQILIDEQHLWKDIAPLFCLEGLKPSELTAEENNDRRKFWAPAFSDEHFDPLKRAVLMSPRLEEDVERHLQNHLIDLERYDVDLCSSLSDVSIPVHGFMLAARSSTLRQAFDIYRQHGEYQSPDFLSITNTGSGRTKLMFQGLDFITLLNLAMYAYTDSVVGVWAFTSHMPKLAFRYRQIRSELLKTATKLEMSKLESSVRSMALPKHYLDVDMTTAMKDPTFFEDGDAILELDDDVEMQVHSQLLCQRCPFFEGLFNGRAGGLWLAGRREDDSEPVRIDLRHIEPSIFQLVLRYLYADVGKELFDDIVAADIDEFCDIVMDVMAVANELMLDRLSQICQQIIGRFVTTRNVCQLLNIVSPCSVTEFKDAGLEYLCLQLESVLENHLLDDLDEDLLLELDEVVRANQLNCLPFSKSGRAELLLLESDPALAEELLEERQRMVRDIAFRANMRDENHQLSSSYKARVGSLDDIMSSSPSQDKGRRKSKAHVNAPFSPSIQPKDSHNDLMFDMDEEDSLALGTSPATPRSLDWKSSRKGSSTNLAATASGGLSPWLDAKGKNPASEATSPRASPIFPSPMVPSSAAKTSPTPDAKPWSAPVISAAKLDMKQIMASTSSNRQSSLSASLSAQKQAHEPTKLSQKERKKQQQQALQLALQAEKPTPEKGGSSSPWQIPKTGAKTSLKEVFGEGKNAAPVSVPAPTPVKSALPSLAAHRTASPDTRYAGQARPSRPSVVPSQASTPTPAPTLPHSKTYKTTDDTPLIPHSKSYRTSEDAASEPALQLSLTEIIEQQRIAAQLRKEAVAKRSLSEIQEEQAFQEWWDCESRRIREEEEREMGRGEKKDSDKEKGKKGEKKGGRGRGGKANAVVKGNGNGTSSADPTGNSTPNTNGHGVEGKNTRGKGRGKPRGEKDKDRVKGERPEPRVAQGSKLATPGPGPATAMAMGMAKK